MVNCSLLTSNYHWVRYLLGQYDYRYIQFISKPELNLRGQLTSLNIKIQRQFSSFLFLLDLM